MPRPSATGQVQQNPAPSFEQLPINSIKEGARHRLDVGNIEEFAENIGKVGLLHPIGVTPDGTLIFGFRRWKACQLLGWDSIPAQIIDIERIVDGEFAENAFRKNFTPSEMVAIKRALEPVEKQAAQERQTEGQKKGRQNRGRAQIAHNQPKHRAAQKAAKLAGASERTIEKAEAVVKAAEAEPEKFAAVAEEMDRTGKVEPAYQTVKAETTPPTTSANRRTLSEPSVWFRKANETERMDFMREAGVIMSIGLQNLLTLIPPKWLPLIVEYYQQHGGGGA